MNKVLINTDLGNMGFWVTVVFLRSALVSNLFFLPGFGGMVKRHS